MTSAIRLMHYDPRWPQEFEQTRSSILHCCEGWVTDVLHVGSTAISGLIAQPIVDVVALVDRDDGWELATTLIEGLNFRLQTPDAWLGAGRRLIKPRNGEETHQVFLFRSGDPVAERMTRIRDWLRDHPDQAVDFEAAKVDRWKCSEGDPEAYAALKQDFFAAVP